ncbi:MAG: Mur ligase family protein, partial [Trebonia sp.]
MPLVTPTEPVPLDQLGRVHFAGIGGAGMSGIAKIMLARGVTVSGSDSAASAALTELAALGARVHVGHSAAHLGDADTLVVSSAIRPDNPELVEARRRGIRVLHRAGALAALMLGRRVIAVTGTHGKTTTTSMITTVLRATGADPSFAIGGSLNESGANAHDGSGDVFVAEADESDGSFLLYTPYAAIVTNVEADHLDHYGTGEAVEQAFVDFAARVEPGGFLVICADDPGARRLGVIAAANGVDVRTYGRSDDADMRLEGLAVRAGGYEFEPVANGRRLGPIQLQVPGAHNALNAAAALSVGLGLGFPAGELRDGLSGFTG